MWVKICGITDEAAIEACAGADAVGFVFAPSPRRVTPARAAALAQGLLASVARVAVFHHATDAEIASVLREFKPDFLQIEPRAGLCHPLLPVFHDGEGLLGELAAWAAHAPGARVLLDAPGVGGRGVAVDRARAAAATAMPLDVVLAGGLCPQRVAQVITALRPAGVDVSSGVERARGIKDPQRIQDFITAARAAAERT